MKLERVLALSLALSMMVGSVTAKTNTTKGAERKQNYIVQTETEQKLQNISKKYQEVETTSDSLPEEIGDSKMTTLSLTKSELDELKKKDIDMEWNKKVIDFVNNIKATTSDTISTPYSTYNISDRNKIDLN